MYKKKGRTSAKEKATREKIVQKNTLRAWEPDEKERYAVKQMIAGGMKQEDIARVAWSGGPISLSTLKRKFPEELRHGKAELTKQVIAVMTELALSGKYPGATMFWLKSQAGWRDHSGVMNNRKFGLDTTEADAVARRLQETAKVAVETLPRAKTGTGDE